MPENPKPFTIRAARPSAFRQFVSISMTLLFTVGLAFILNQFVFQSFFVDGESMSPTLHTGDRLIVSRVERTISALRGQTYLPERGQIVVIDGNASPTTQERAPELIKRVVGLPGDKVHIENDTITIMTPTEGAFDYNEKYGLALEPTHTDNPIDVTVPANSVYVVGDNRTQGGSLDSRVFGPVDARFVDGRLAMRIMPFTQFRVF